MEAEVAEVVDETQRMPPTDIPLEASTNSTLANSTLGESYSRQQSMADSRHGSMQD